MTEELTCATCRHARTDKQKKVIDATGFGDQMMFEDEDQDEVVYTCGAPGGEHEGKFLGAIPVSCASARFAERSAGAERLADLDRLIAQREEREARRIRDE